MGHSKKVALLSYGLWLERFANRTKWRDPKIEIDLEPFLKSLPERAKEVEISDDELKQLQCHNPHWCNLLATMTKNSIEYIESAFDMIEMSLRRDGALDLIPDFMQYVDAYSVVNSRCFQANGVDENYPEFVRGVRALFNHFLFFFLCVCYNYVSQIARISLTHNTARKALENQLSNTNLIVTKTQTPTLEHRYPV